MHMTSEGNNIYILGSGRFGKRAAKLLQKRIKDGVITVVDQHPESLAALEAIGCQTITMDAIAFLVDNADQISPNDWIIPAVPLHVAYAWLRAVIGPDSNFKEIAIPDSIRSHIPNPLWGNQGQVYTSIATFLCPEDCSEPKNFCTFTAKPRSQSLWKTLSDLAIPDFRSICIVSHQLAPGVGGFQFKSLHQAQQFIEINPEKFLLCTACKCHGVVNAFTSRIESDTLIKK